MEFVEKRKPSGKPDRSAAAWSFLTSYEYAREELARGGWKNSAGSG
jgi:hypothetical protein